LEIIFGELVAVSGLGLDMVDLVVLDTISQESLFGGECMGASCPVRRIGGCCFDVCSLHVATQTWMF
jgi:hypothetical protein